MVSIDTFCQHVFWAVFRIAGMSRLPFYFPLLSNTGHKFRGGFKETTFTVGQFGLGGHWLATQSFSQDCLGQLFCLGIGRKLNGLKNFPSFHLELKIRIKSLFLIAPPRCVKSVGLTHLFTVSQN